MIILLILFLLPLTLSATNNAVICVPVADLLGQSIKTIYPHQSVAESYNMLPVCWKKNPQLACPRLHQLVYNDVVNVLEHKDDEVRIQINNLFYTIPTSSIPQTTYWTLAKNIRLLDDLKNNNVKTDHIPQPYSFLPQEKKPSYRHHVITLVEPHYDKVTHLTFSVGTRFVCVQKPKQSLKKLKVFVINHEKNKEMTTYIPTHKCYFNTTTIAEEQVNQFVLLLKSWSHQNNGFIPYVWGGTSFTSSFSSPFKETTKKINDATYSSFEFENDVTSPKSGFDCSGVIGRAAQICNLPYFYKNTTTIDAHLSPLEETDTLTNGDLILVKGHVMIISDREKNLLIEARGYSHGYGKLHEIELQEIFDSIKTYKDLCEAFFAKKNLTIKDKHGNSKNTYKNWKILKIMSIYK